MFSSLSLSQTQNMELKRRNRESDDQKVEKDFKEVRKRLYDSNSLMKIIMKRIDEQRSNMPS